VLQHIPPNVGALAGSKTCEILSSSTVEEQYWLTTPKQMLGIKVIHEDLP
jgi:hypothetical protein